MENRAIADKKPVPPLDGDISAQQCSLLANCRDIAMLAATLANGGVHPITGRRMVSAQYVRNILRIMFTSMLKLSSVGSQERIVHGGSGFLRNYQSSWRYTFFIRMNDIQ